MSIETFQNTPGVEFHASCPASSFDDLQAVHRICLPPPHEQMLRASNGVEAYFGCFRLFGLSTSETIDSILWNREDYWKFAWNDRCLRFWCFGENVFGDQYAYLVDDIFDGRESIYSLDAFSMKAEPIAEDFEAFIINEFFRNAGEPYDSMITAAHEKFGAIDANEHLVYLPSLLLGGTEQVENLEKMDARSAMICNGDIALQLDECNSSGKVRGVLSYVDEKGRSRLRLEV